MEPVEDVIADWNSVTIDTMARLVREAMEQFDWKVGTVEQLVDRIRRLEFGLPAEDHFIALLSWLGRCQLVHKIDQEVYPLTERGSVRIPDLLAVFRTPSGERSVAIEVKTTVDKKISWRSDYVNQLRKYSSLIGMPVLVSCYWRWHGINLWTLNDLDTFVLAKTNYHLTWQTALRENLLGVLAGDFNIVLKSGVGIHFVFKKIDLVSSNAMMQKQQWKTELAEVYFTNSNGERLTDGNNDILSLLMHFPLEEKTKIDEIYIHHSFIVSAEQTMMFAQQGLFSFKRDDSERWSSILNSGRADPGAEYVRNKAAMGFETKVSQYILDVRPQTMPVWLKAGE